MTRAFPNDFDAGMSLHNWYMGQAITGLCASHGIHHFNNEDGIKEIVKMAKAIADEAVKDD